MSQINIDLLQKSHLSEFLHSYKSFVDSNLAYHVIYVMFRHPEEVSADKPYEKK